MRPVPGRTRLTTALYERFSSRGEADYADKVLSAMRKEFSGHEELPTVNKARATGGEVDSAWGSGI